MKITSYYFSILTLISFQVFFLSININTYPSHDIPQHTYETPVIKYVGPWLFHLPKAHIIVVRDDELKTLTDPDKEINISLTNEPQITTLRKICEDAQKRGVRTLIIAFDHFFSQYRPGQNTPRLLTPDTDDYIRVISQISKFTEQYGIGLELSFLTPLELRSEFTKQTGESGQWMQFVKDFRDPQTGAYSVNTFQHKKWANNKGTIELELVEVKVFAFNEIRYGNDFRVVPPNTITDISETVQVEEYPGSIIKHGDFQAMRIRVFGKGGVEKTNGNRVLIVLIYRTPEMDYFSDNAYPFLKSLCDKYLEAGIKLHGLYSDEIHIQQDWAYHSHHERGQFNLRYISPGFQKVFAKKYGEEFSNLALYTLYFIQGQETFAEDLTVHQPIQHIMSPGLEGILKTALFRARYYRLLQNGVVDLFTSAKKYLENKLGYQLEARAHATWAESPTCDYWRKNPCENFWNYAYEYTPDFIWSNTVHQAASACYDYFKWGEFLTGNGNDHPEGGFLDRNYFGLAIACSTGNINEYYNSYCGHWGMPSEISNRRQAICDVFGTNPWLPFALVEDFRHRVSDVLMLYPLNLLAVDERFGSWMIQYGYADYITSEKLLELGKFERGKCIVNGREYNTIVALFEPFPPSGLLENLKSFVSSGGNLIWIGTPSYFDLEGNKVIDNWNEMFGIKVELNQSLGCSASGKEVEFINTLSHIPPMPILTNFIVDYIYPLTPQSNTLPIAKCKGNIVGSEKIYNEKGGKAVYLGFRPRDNQSGSLGKETKWLFDILCTYNSYSPSGKFPEYNDNPEYLSRTSQYIFTRFPNGAIGVAPHLKDLEENWEGGFARDREKDNSIVERLNLPPHQIELTETKVWRHTITYSGSRAVVFRADESSNLLAFAGNNSKEITIDGKQYIFSDAPLNFIGWAPVPEERKVENGAIMILIFSGSGVLSIPMNQFDYNNYLVFAEGSIPGTLGESIASEFIPTKKILRIITTPSVQGRIIYILPDKNAN
ncbi:MAG: hypothetical protein N3G21_03575 [Candidatus Hydrogenedentes bacterium]|nr:hypothetical protein [Candidatus Hydrogenedentota bacterium]